MYQLKEEAKELINKKFKISYLVEKTGVTRQYIWMIVSKNRTCSKDTAYYITKAIDSESEIKDFFIRLK